MPPQPLAFIAGPSGAWRIESIAAVMGEGLASAERLDVREETGVTAPSGAVWILRAVTSSLRYTTDAERVTLVARQPALGRPEATRAVLIPIRKTEAWWNLAQDRRRAIFEESSRHTTIALEYLPAVARRLSHSRDLGEPFDFLTWFEFAPADAGAFDELLRRLRASEEWTYVEREVDVRLSRS